MKRLPCLFSLLVLSTSVVMAVTCYAQEQEAVTVPQAIDERATTSLVHPTFGGLVNRLMA
jgi:hypothetical protein